MLEFIDPDLLESMQGWFQSTGDLWPPDARIKDLQTRVTKEDIHDLYAHLLSVAPLRTERELRDQFQFIFEIPESELPPLSQAEIERQARFEKWCEDHFKDRRPLNKVVISEEPLDAAGEREDVWQARENQVHPELAKEWPEFPLKAISPDSLVEVILERIDVPTSFDLNSIIQNLQQRFSEFFLSDDDSGCSRRVELVAENSSERVLFEFAVYE